MNPQQQHYATYNPQQQQFYARQNSDNLSAYATQNASPMGVSPPLHAWVPPSPPEQQYYDMLFAHVDEQHRNAISGQQAVAFFTRSHLDNAILREVWSIADVQRRSELSRNEFYVAMRLIGMAQRGEQVSVQRFLQFAAMPFPLPAMEGVPQPPQGMHPSGGNGMQQQTQPQAPMQQDFGSAQHPPTGNRAGYALTADEKSKYDIVFQQYDTDRDGFLMGPEAVALFQMSGLDRNVLRDIWSMADVTQDSKLSVQEFYVAMHLIVCVSKRALPMPPTLPRELAETAFGVGGSVPGMPNHDGFGSQVSGPSSQSGFQVQQQESVPAPKPEGMSAFDSLSTAEDAPLPSFDSSTPRSSQAESFNHTGANTAPNLVGGFGEPSVPTPTSSFQGGFPAPTGQPDFNNFSTSRTPSVTCGAGRDRTNSASSLNSMSSLSGLAPLPPQQPTQQLPPRSLGSNERIQMAQVDNASFQAPPQNYSSFGAASFGAPLTSAAVQEKPFMSDEEEKNVARQLDQQNDEVIQTLASVERKQTAIEMISEKLRDLDELRHELVTLVMKREDLRSASASALGSADNSAEELTRHAVEQSLRGLVENQKQLIHQLQCDISRHEGELEEAVLSAKLQQKLSLESRSPLIDAVSPPLSSHNSAAVGSGTNVFTGAPLPLDGSSAAPSPVAIPSAPSISAFSPLPSPDATDSSGFNAFSNFDSAPRSIASATPSPAAAVPSGSPFSPTPSPSQIAGANGSFNAISDFAAPLSTDATPSLLSGADEAPGKSPFSPTPSPAASIDNPAGFDAFGAAPSSSPVPTADAPATSPFSPFSPSPSPAATDDNGFHGFSDSNAAPSSSPAATAEASGNSLFSPTPSPAAATSTNSGSAFASTDFAAPSSLPVADADNSLLSPSPTPTVAETPAFDAFAAAPIPSSDAATPANAFATSGNSPFSPVAAKTSDSDAFGDFGAAASTDNAAAPSETTANHESTGNLLPSPVAATDNGGNAFGDFGAPPASTDSVASTPAQEKTTGNSPFSPVAADSTDVNGFGDFSAAPDSAATVDKSTPENPAGSSGNSPFSPIAKDDAGSSFEAFGDFNAATDSSAAPSEPSQTANANGSSPFSPVAADNSGFGAFGDFNAAPAPTESTSTPSETTKPTETSGISPFSPVAVDNGGFDAFGDFNAAPTSTNDSKTETTKETNGFSEFGDFSAAPASSEGFGDFCDFK